jgi:hypothetical protein
VLQPIPVSIYHLTVRRPLATGVGACSLGHLAFKRMKPAFADVL